MKKKLKKIYGWVKALRYKKYLIVIVLGVLFIGFIGESSVVSHLQNKATKAEIQQETNYYQGVYDKAQKELHDLVHNHKTVVRKVRELYYSKADDEDIYILSCDDEPKEKQH